MKKRFTLIELILVVVTIGVLVSIVMLNVKGWKEKAMVSAIQSNIRQIQNAVDRYKMKTNEIPTVNGMQPSVGNPQRVSIEKLTKDYLTNEPQVGNYWLDEEGTVWGSTTELPRGFVVEDGVAKWLQHDTSSTYTIWERYMENVVGSANKSRWKKKVELRNEGKGVGSIELGSDYYNVFIQARDQYGLETPIVGNIPSETVARFPLSGNQQFTLTTDAGDLAEWTGVTKREYIPEGASISYRFSGSRDGKVFGEPKSEITEIGEARVVKTTIIMRSNGGLAPRLDFLRLNFSLKGRIEVSSSGVKEVMHARLEESNYIPISNVDNWTKVSYSYKTEEESYLHRVRIPVTKESVSKRNEPHEPLERFESSALYKESLGMLLENRSIRDIVSEGSGVFVTYQSSIDGVNYSKPTTLPQSVPKGMHFIAHVHVPHTIENMGHPVPKPVLEVSRHEFAQLKGINQTGGKGSRESHVPDETGQDIPRPDKESDYEEVSRISIVEDAGNVGHWISVHKKENLPQGTKIRYLLSTSNDGDVWSNPTEDISRLPESRMLRVTILFERKKGSTHIPVVEELYIEYRLKETNETVKRTVRVPQTIDPNKPTAIISSSNDAPFGKYYTNTFFKWDHRSSIASEGRRIVTAEWRNNLFNYPTKGMQTVQLRVRDDAGVWSNWTTQTIYIRWEEGDLKNEYDRIFKGAEDTVYAVTREGKLKSWGQSSIAGLGTGENSSFSPRYVPIEGEVDVIKNIGTNNFAFMKDGNIYVWGENDYKSLGVHSLNRPIQTPVLFPHFKADEIAQIDGDSTYTFFLLKTGEVYGVGHDYSSIFGKGTDRKTYINPVKIELPDKVVKMETSHNQIVYLLENGELWGSGSNAWTTKNMDSKGVRYSTYRFETSDDVKDVWSDGGFVIYKTLENEYFGWGYNKYDQIRKRKNTSTSENGIYSPELLPILTSRQPKKVWAFQSQLFYTYGNQDILVQQHTGPYRLPSNISGIKNLILTGGTVYETLDKDFHLMNHSRTRYCNVTNAYKGDFLNSRLNTSPKSEMKEWVFTGQGAVFLLDDGSIEFCGDKPYGNVKASDPVIKPTPIERE